MWGELWIDIYRERELLLFISLALQASWSYILSMTQKKLRNSMVGAHTHIEYILSLFNKEEVSLHPKGID